MTWSETPAAARRTVRLAIRDARTARGFTQVQVADAMDWSLSKVIRIERGEVTVSRRDLLPLLEYLGVDNVEDLVLAAKAARRQGAQWWDQTRFDALLTPAMKQWFGHEAEATSILAFSSTHFPGFLQTAQIAGPVLESFADELAPDERAARLEARSLRRHALDSRPTPIQAHVLLDESLLFRTLGRPDALRRQLGAVLEVIEQGWTTVRIAPFTQPLPGIGSFDVALLGPEESGHAVLYRENGTTDEIVDDPATIGRYLTVWHTMWDHALDESRSTAMITARAEEIAESVPPTKKRLRRKSAP